MKNSQKSRNFESNFFVYSRHFLERLHLVWKSAKARTKTKFATLEVIFVLSIVLITEQSELNQL